MGRHLAEALLKEGHAVRCLARDLAKVQHLATAGCEIVRGDITDLASVQRAVNSVQAIYISIHTLSLSRVVGVALWMSKNRYPKRQRGLPDE